MKRKLHHAVCCCLVLATVGLAAMTAAIRARAQAVAPPAPVSPPPAPPDATAGRKVHIDPATGRIVEPPPRVPGRLPPPLPPIDDRHSTSTEGLRMTPVTTRAGGVKVNLQGRFRHNVVVATGPDGRPAARCRVDAPAPADEITRKSSPVR